MATVVALYKGKHKLFNRLLSAWLASQYSHCELVEVIVSGAMLSWSSSIQDGGVRQKFITITDDWELWVVGADRTRAHQWFRERDGLGYDFLGLFGFVVRWIKGSNRRYFCSEAVAASLGFEDPFRFSPADLASIVKRIGTPYKQGES